jgi:hypothetical protein
MMVNTDTQIGTGLPEMTLGGGAQQRFLHEIVGAFGVCGSAPGYNAEAAGSPAPQADETRTFVLPRSDRDEVGGAGIELDAVQHPQREMV